MQTPLLVHSDYFITLYLPITVHFKHCLPHYRLTVRKPWIPYFTFLASSFRLLSRKCPFSAMRKSTSLFSLFVGDLKSEIVYTNGVMVHIPTLTTYRRTYNSSEGSTSTCHVMTPHTWRMVLVTFFSCRIFSKYIKPGCLTETSAERRSVPVLWFPYRMCNRVSIMDV